MPQTTQENEVVQLFLDDIIPNRFQPREVFDEKALKELAVSIKEHGVIQPIIVRNIGNKYEIIAGERRYKASALAGLTKIPAIVRNLDDKESSKVALLENLQRKNLNPIEEARTYQKILELDEMTQEELAKTMGKSQGAVANKLRLLALPDAVQDAVLKEQISERHARSLLSIEDAEAQKEMLKRVISEKMTVRDLEKEINPQGTDTKQAETEVNNNVENNTNNVQDLIQNIPDQVQEITPFQAPTGDTSSIVDYSTPPKFIDYGLEDDDNSSEEPEGTSSALGTPDIDTLRQNAQDIHMDVKPTADLDSLLQVSQNNAKQEEQKQETFKFINPNMDSQETSSKAGTMSDDYFKVPDITPPENKEIIPPSDPFQIPPVPSMNNNHTTPTVETNTQPQEIPHFEDALEEIRNTVSQLEKQGIRVEIDEMDFDKNYQIVIRLMK